MYTLTIVIGLATIVMIHLTWIEAQAMLVTEEYCGAKCYVEKE